MYSNQTELDIKKLWNEKEIPNKVRTRKTNKPFYFIDGPPYASGHIHLGTALNRILKDIVIRFKRSTGFEVLDIPGFDTHGVPIERKVQIKYSLKSKEDIEEFGVEKFIQECYKFATENITQMSKDIENLGQWMDWEHPYRTLDKSYMLSEWWTFKKAADKGLLYHGKYPVHVCPSCETSVSFNEIEHVDLKDTSVFVKMQDVEDENKFYVIWTTTPWTLPANMGIMVHPKYEYVEVLVGSEKYVVAKKLLEILAKKFNWENYEVVNTFLGKDLVGKRYKPILGEWIEISDDFKERGYRIVPSPRYVHLEGGTGLVHCAPGHGREDYAVGNENNLPAYSPVTISGEYDSTVPKFEGQKVKQLDPYIIEYLTEKNKVLAQEKIKHSYPTCWRCHTPLLQVSLPQWFLKVENQKDKLLELNSKVTWNPPWGKDRFDDWLKGLSDWPISRSRYWGTPMPVWKCESCGKIEVFGSLEELKERNPDVDLDMDIHKPYIDKVELTCKSCGHKMKRVPEVLDVWFDSGVASWASLGYPKNKELFNKYWPPDMNFEGSDQVRGWWNSQLITSAISFDKAPFKAISLHGMVLDGSKRKLSKSEGNDIPLLERFSKLSIDYYRYYFAREYNGVDLVLNESKFKNIRRVFNLLENILNFIKLYDPSFEFTTTLNVGQEQLPVEDRWILSKLNSLIKSSLKNYNSTSFSKVISDFEKFTLEDFSRVYIKLLRKRTNKNKVLIYVYSSILLLLTPVAPHFTEYIYQSFNNKAEESIHLLLLPEVNESLINLDLESNFDLAQLIVTTSLSLREQEKRRLRWILPRLVVKIKDSKALSELSNIISTMSNVEKVEFVTEPQDSLAGKEVTTDVVVYIDKEVPASYKEVWEVSELVRLIQSERKAKKLNQNDQVKIKIASDSKEFLERNKDTIEKATNSVLEIAPELFDSNKTKLIEKEVSFSF